MSAPLAAATKRARPVHGFNCEECGKLIRKPGDGYLAVRYPDAIAAEFACEDREYENRHRVNADGLPVPPPRAILVADWPYRPDARWDAFHYRCHSDTDPGLYVIEMERITEWWQVADWTAHLLGTRAWLKHTNWPELLRHFAGLGANESPA
jgi:hypothetical protein